MIPDILEILLRAFVVVLAVIILTRLNGLRSFSKMSSFDFAITVACGSVIASSVISPKENLSYGIAALVGLFAVQAIIACARVKYDFAKRAFDNTPLLVMKDGKINRENLEASRMTEADLFGKLREANAFNLSRVRAVVLEATGDVSVLHDAGDPDDDVSTEILQGVEQ